MTRLWGLLGRGDSWGYPIGVYFIILFPHITAQIYVFIPWLGWSNEGIAVFLLYNIFVLGIYYNYYLACSTDPGSPPPGWAPEEVSSISEQDGDILLRTTQPDQVPLLQRNGGQDEPTSSTTVHTPKQPRFCKKCQAFKPPRSHHCRDCNRCILKMDHHCRWTNNCIGHKNHGYFLRFLLFVGMATSTGIITLFSRIFSYGKIGNRYPYQQPIDPLEIVFLFIDLIFLIPVVLSVGILSLYQLYYVMINTTTIEAYEKDRVKSAVRRGKLPRTPYPFDVGFFTNLREVLGIHPLLWFLPMPPLGNGLAFPVKPGCEHITWPPREEDHRPTIPGWDQRRRVVGGSPVGSDGISDNSMDHQGEDDDDEVHQSKGGDAERYVVRDRSWNVEEGQDYDSKTSHAPQEWREWTSKGAAATIDDMARPAPRFAHPPPASILAPQPTHPSSSPVHMGGGPGSGAAGLNGGSSKGGVGVEVSNHAGIRTYSPSKNLKGDHVD